MPDVGSYLEQYNLLASMNAVDVASLVAQVANRLGITEDAATPPVMAALDYISHDTGLATVDFPTADELLNQGVVLLAMRIYQDVPNLGGETNNIDATFTGIYTPSRLYSHLDEYWRHLAVQWGIA